MRARAISRRPLSVDESNSSFEAVLFTETPVRTWICDPSGKLDDHGDPAWIEVDEVLLMSGINLSRLPGMPLVDTHDTSSIENVLGVVDSARIEDVQIGDTVGPGLVIRPRVMPTKREKIIPNIKDGFLQQLSGGYVVSRYELETREGQVPIAYATDWTALEASMVPVGADLNAVVRSVREQRVFPLPTVSIRSAAGSTPEQKRNNMDYEALVTAAEAAVAAVEAAVEAIPADAPEGTAEDVVERARKLRSARAEGDMTPEEQAAEAEKPADKAEEAAVEQVRSLAKGYGKDVVKLVDDLAKLSTRSNDIRVAVRSAIVKRGITSEPGATPKPPVKATDNTIDVRAIYAARAKR